MVAEAGGDGRQGVRKGDCLLLVEVIEEQAVDVGDVLGGDVGEALFAGFGEGGVLCSTVLGVFGDLDVAPGDEAAKSVSESTLGGVGQVGKIAETQGLVGLLCEGDEDSVLHPQQVLGLERPLELGHCPQEYDQEPLPCLLFGLVEPACVGHTISLLWLTLQV